MTSKSTTSNAKKSFATPDQHEDFTNGTLDLVSMGNSTLGRVRLNPGWRYSESVQQMSTTPHIAYITQGELHITDNSGNEIVAGPDEVAEIRDGYDAWCEEPTEIIDFSNPRQFANMST